MVISVPLSGISRAEPLPGFSVCRMHAPCGPPASGYLDAPLIQPEVNARRIPCVGLGDDVQATVAVHIGYARLVVADANGQLPHLKIAMAIAV